MAKDVTSTRPIIATDLFLDSSSVSLNLICWAYSLFKFYVSIHVCITKSRKARVSTGHVTDSRRDPTRLRRPRNIFLDFPLSYQLERRGPPKSGNIGSEMMATAVSTHSSNPF